MDEKTYAQLCDFYQAKLDGISEPDIRDKNSAKDLLSAGCITRDPTFPKTLIITRHGVNEFFNAQLSQIITITSP